MKENCAKSILNELKPEKFALQHNQVEHFYQSQWQSGDRSVYYLLYRWMWALFFTCVFTVCLVLQYCDGKFFIFLTNWGILLCVMTNLLAAVLVTQWHFNLGAVRTSVYENGLKGGGRTPGAVKVYWVLHTITLSLALVITTIYWTFLHGKMNKPMRFPVISYVTHCLNSVFMLIDFLVVAFPSRILHIFYSMMLSIAYYGFTVIYFYCGGLDEFGNPYVYTILDWHKPGRALITFAGAFSLFLIYSVLLFFVYKLKCLIHRKFNVVWTPHAVGLI